MHKFGQRIYFEMTNANEPPAPRIFISGPLATHGLIAIFAIVYFCELYFAVDANHGFSPSVTTLAYLGGDLGSRVIQDHEYWRMFTAPLMHGGPEHILLNSFVLLLSGTMLERIVGWKWLLGIFTITALGGEIATLFFLSHNVVGVGASGGVMGVLGALFAIAGRLPLQFQSAMRTRAIQFLIPSLLPIFYSSGSNVNYFAHAGGALTGVILGYALLKSWAQDQAEPPLRNSMAAAALGFFAVAAYAIYPIMKLYNS
jgi:membrane associated rhomboid family serine protease